MVQPGDREILAFWLKQKREAERTLDETLEEGRTWFRRAKLAAEEGRNDLAAQARDRAMRARDRHRAAELRIQEADVEIARLKEDAAGTGPSPAAIRAQQIRENFEAMGVDIAAAELDELGESVQAEDALRALRERMNKDSDPTGDGSE